MATTKPRITLSISPELYSELARFAALQKRPMASCVTEYLEHIRPTFAKISDAIDYAHRLQMYGKSDGCFDAAADGVVEAFESAVNTHQFCRMMASEAGFDLDEGGYVEVTGAEPVEPAQPPCSNTGVRISVDKDGIPC